MKSTRRAFAALATLGMAVAGVVAVLALSPSCGPEPSTSPSIDTGRAPPAAARTVVLHVGGMQKSRGGPT